MFSDNILKKFEKIPFYSQKFLTTFFKSSTTFFKNLHPSFKIYSLFFVFFFLCLCFCFLSCFLFLNKRIKNSRLIIGGQKGVLPPILIIGGRVPGLPPESTPMVGGFDPFVQFSF